LESEPFLQEAGISPLKKPAWEKSSLREIDRARLADFLRFHPFAMFPPLVTEFDKYLQSVSCQKNNPPRNTFSRNLRNFPRLLRIIL
jgi:hypothetical protein